MIIIRNSTEKDIAILIDFQFRLALETEAIALNTITVRTGIEALFIDPSKGRYFIVESGGKISGCFLLTSEWSDWRNGMVYWLQSVYVKKEFRKKGIFKAILDYLSKLIKEDKRICGLRLYVNKSNTKAQNIYAKLGMNGDHYTVFELMKTLHN